jgi:stage III sporulation protein AE
MKRIIILFFVIIPLFMLPVCASSTNDIINDQMKTSDANTVIDKTPQNAKSALDKLGINGIDPTKLSSLKADDIFNYILKQISNEASKPVKSLAAIAGILILCALLENLKNSFGEKSLAGIFETAAAICISTAVLIPVLECITRVGKTIETASTFMLSFIPVYTGLMVASGSPTGAAVYNTLLFSVTEIISRITSTSLVPLINIFLALCIIGSISSQLNLSGITSFIKSSVNWICGISLTIFVGLITLQGTLASAADNVASKTAKFVISGFVPVVGSALGDALNTVVGCAGVIKSATGVYGILVLVIIFLPPLLQSIIWLTCIRLASGAAEILGSDRIKQLMNNISTAIGVMIALLLTSAALLIISATVVLTVGGKT